MNHLDELKQWDAWIRGGQAAKVRALCRKVDPKKIPRVLLTEYAHIARRIGAPDFIVHWLRPVVRPDKPLMEKASDSERALYALGLLRLGAFREGQQLLSEIEPLKNPEVYFYRASMNISQWNYAKAIPDLRKYLRRQDTPVYLKRVTQLNLCLALAADLKLDLAMTEITKLMRQVKREKNILLEGNLLEVRAQIFYHQNQDEKALQDLNEANIKLQRADERSQLYVEKMSALIRLKSSPEDPDALAYLEAVQSRAQISREWEIVRDCDLHRALILHDENLLLRVYWGSRFKEYKHRVLRQFGSAAALEKSFHWSSSLGPLDEQAPVIDLVQTAPTLILKKLFFILTRELYSPLHGTEILDALYPGDHYHPISSPAKLHRLIARARTWLRENKMAITIQNDGSTYRLNFQAPVRLHLQETLELEKNTPLPAITTQDFFNAKQWATEKQISERAARVQIQKLVTQGLIEMQARGPRTRYRLKRR